MLKLAARAGRMVIAGLLMVGPAALAAPTIHWTSIGPHDGGVSTLASTPGAAGLLWTVFPGLGLRKSVDGGASWTAAPLPAAQSYYGVTADPVDPLTLYATGRAGVAKTADGGATWKVINPTPDAVLGVAPGAPRTLYLASPGNAAFLATVSRSDDGGATWQPLAALSPGTESIREIDVDPANPDNVYLLGAVFHLDASAVVVHSTDGGQSWSFLPRLPGDGFLRSLILDPRSPGTLLTLVGQGPARSLDGGATWQIAGAGLPANSLPTGFAFDRSTGTWYLTLYTSSGTGVWASTDDGTSWTELSERPGSLALLGVDGGLPNRLYAGADAGQFLVSTDGGRHWQAAGAGFAPPLARSLVADPHAAGTLYAVLSPQPDFRVGTLSVPSLGRTQDGGATWTTWAPVDASGQPVYLGELVFDPFVANTIYSPSGPFFYRSADGGRTWTAGRYPDGFSGAQSLTADPLHPGVLFAAGVRGDGGSDVLRSANRGRSWTSVLQVPQGQPVIETVLVDPTPPLAVFAAGRAGFWRSLDGGQTWDSSLGLGLPPASQDVTRLRTDSSDNLYALALVYPGQSHTLYKSTDRGAHWAPVDAGLPAGTSAWDLLSQGNSLYAATTNGVFLSQDGGAHWTAASDGLPSTLVNRLAAGSGDGSLYAATYLGLAASRAPAVTCPASDTVLCLEGGRFALSLHWTLPDGTAGDGHAVQLTDGGGGFWYFSPESLERVIKVVDGRPLNGHFWLFGGSLSDLASTLTVTEVATGVTRTLRNRQGRLMSFSDTTTFAGKSAGLRAGGGPVSTPAEAAVPGDTQPCGPSAGTLCLGGSRFAVRVTWRLPGAAAASATAVPLVPATGAFWFSDPGTPELLVKVIDGRPLNGHFWVYLGGLSTVDYTVTVTDTGTGTSKSYHHPAGALASSADTVF